jgi:hypothetical protein
VPIIGVGIALYLTFVNPFLAEVKTAAGTANVAAVTTVQHAEASAG